MYFKTALKSKTLAVNKQWWFDWMRSKRSWFSSNAESSSRTGSKTRSSYPVGKTWERFLSDPKEIVEKILSWSIAWRLDWPGIPLGHLDNNRGSVLAQLPKRLGNFSWYDLQEDFKMNEEPRGFGLRCIQGLRFAAFMKQILSSDVNNLLLIHLSLDNQGEWIWEYFKFIGELFRT